MRKILNDFINISFLTDKLITLVLLFAFVAFNQIERTEIRKRDKLVINQQNEVGIFTYFTL